MQQCGRAILENFINRACRRSALDFCLPLRLPSAIRPHRRADLAPPIGSLHRLRGLLLLFIAAFNCPSQYTRESH
jgi:hypothetical protein